VEPLQLKGTAQLYDVKQTALSPGILHTADIVMSPSVDIERLPYLTTRIQCMLHNGQSSVGTAFFTRLEHPRFPEPQYALITNKHVVCDAVRGSIVLHEAHPTEPSNSTGNQLCLEVENFANQWIPHPDDSIDLCICPLGRLNSSFRGLGKKALMGYVIREHIPTDSELRAMSVVEEVLMIGYPTGLWDSYSNLPIIRKGMTAIHPAVDFRGEPVSVVDIAAFPGSSGSPVFAVSQVTTADGHLIIAEKKLTFLGVLFAGPTTDIHGEIVRVPVPTAHSISTKTQVMIHLGFIIKARAIMPLINALEELLLRASLDDDSRAN